MKAFILIASALVSSGVFAAGYRPSLTITGVGFDKRITRHTQPPPEADMRAKADADGRFKCDALWGTGAELTLHKKPKYEVFGGDEPGAQMYGSYKVDYDCKAGTDDFAALAQHLVNVLVHESEYKYQSGEPMRVPDYAIWAFAYLGDAAVPALLEKLHYPRLRVQHYVMDALVSTGTTDARVIEEMFGLLSARDQDTREDAAFNLRSIVAHKNVDAAKMIERALPLLKSGDVDTRRLGFDIVAGLGKRGATVKPVLWDLVRKYPDEWLPPLPTDALIDIGLDETDIPLIIGFARETNRHPNSRGDLISCLGTMKKKAASAVPFLLEVIETDPNTFTKIFEGSAFGDALGALKRIGPTGDEALNARVLARLTVLVTNERYGQSAGEAKTVFEEPKKRVEEEKANRARGEASRREAEAIEKGGLDLSALTEKLKSTDFSVRLAAIHALDERNAEQVIAAVTPMLASADKNARSGACDLLAGMRGKAKAAKPALFAVYRRFPGEVEDGFSSAGSALRDIGVTADDMPTLLELFALPGLNPVRRSSLARMMGALKSEARAALPALLKVIAQDLTKQDTMKAGAHNNPVDGDVVEAVKAIAAIGLSGDAQLDGRLVNRLRELKETDHFNVPSWLVEEAKKALAAFPIN